MAYIYKVTRNIDVNDPKQYDKISCYKITKRERVETKNDQYFTCYYHNGDHICRQRAGIDEGLVYGKNFAFWLNERDDQKAIDILKKVFSNRKDSRRKRISEESRKLLWEMEYISNLSIKSIESL